MSMETLQIRLSKAQLNAIDREVEEGTYPSRSEAIRDYLRKAQAWETFQKIVEMGHSMDLSENELQSQMDKVRKDVYEDLIRSKNNPSS